ncbi:PREDICTED: cytochrome P450 6B2-like isoform X2 [Vollenhovia emeryi]|uniref:cytochrome P450 6B2-like isoform X2 n=1 Tax=Vollenhovia emeryi TaxID=411798 RepID=UPI0005F58876|nr:PREDICTED: cytochrome P450 6B2-like isoform X2 [Vollenhovia emeryi]
MLGIVAVLLDPFLLIGLFLGSLYFYLTATFDFWECRGVPFKKPTVLVGNFGPLLLFRKSLPEGVKEMYQWFEDERFFGAFRVRSPVLIVRDPDLVRSIFVKDFPCFLNRGIPVNNDQDPLSGHLFNLEGRKWKGLRSKLTPAFSSGKLKRMFYLLVECSEELRRLIGEASRNDDRTVEVRELAAKFIIDVIGSCAFGIQINALTDNKSEFHRAAKMLSKPSYKTSLWRMLRTAMPRLYKLLDVQLVDPSVTRFFMDVVSQMINQRENNGRTTRHDFMDLLIELRNKGTLENEAGSPTICSDEDAQAARETELDENSIAAQAFVFFAAGYETSSSTIAFCLYELALNQEIQDRTRREVRDAIQARGGKLTYDAVQDMKYLDMVILGMRFALLQIKMGIISFLRDHRVEKCDKSTVPIKFSRRSLVTTSEAGFWLAITSFS